jgi:peptide-methionine (R)-S-oxide reductase
MTRSQLTALALAMAAAAAAPGYLTWKAYTTMPKDEPRPIRTFPVTKTDEEWQASLTPRQYAVLRRHDTEYPGTSPLLEEHRDGTFACAGCDYSDIRDACN